LTRPVYSAQVKSDLPTRGEYEELFAAQREKLRRMAYLFLHEEAAVEDAVQETFTRGLAKLHTFRAESRFDVWVYSIALNVCRQAYRRARLDEKLTDPRGRGASRRSIRGPLTSLMRREQASRMAVALGYLTDLQREAFVLHYVEELPYESIAPMLGVSVVGARGLAHRARRVLRSKLPPSFEMPGAK
jgi:RNA polymerase sigma factor (sigma-70 family)